MKKGILSFTGSTLKLLSLLTKDICDQYLKLAVMTVRKKIDPKYPRPGDLIECREGVGLVISVKAVRWAGLVADVNINGKIRKIEVSGHKVISRDARKK